MAANDGVDVEGEPDRPIVEDCVDATMGTVAVNVYVRPLLVSVQVVRDSEGPLEIPPTPVLLAVGEDG